MRSGHGTRSLTLLNQMHSPIERVTSSVRLNLCSGRRRLHGRHPLGGGGAIALMLIPAALRLQVALRLLQLLNEGCRSATQLLLRHRSASLAAGISSARQGRVRPWVGVPELS